MWTHLILNRNASLLPDLLLFIMPLSEYYSMSSAEVSVYCALTNSGESPVSKRSYSMLPVKAWQCKTYNASDTRNCGLYSVCLPTCGVFKTCQNLLHFIDRFYCHVLQAVYVLVSIQPLLHNILSLYSAHWHLSTAKWQYVMHVVLVSGARRMISGSKYTPPSSYYSYNAQLSCRCSFNLCACLLCKQVEGQ